VAGLPGAPVRVTQTTSLVFNTTATIDGSPPVLHLAVFVPTDTVAGRRYTTDDFVDLPQLAATAAITQTVIGVDASGGGSPAQQAVAAALLKAANVPLPPPGVGPPIPGQMPASGSPAYAAAQRFAALPPATRHAWLATHLPALRAGQISLTQLP